MAILGRWTGGVIGSLVPALNSWGSPSNLFPTEARNDGAAYGFASATSTITVPAAGLPDGYLLRASVETENSLDGRYNLQGRFVQSAGTSTAFKSLQTSGYSRDLSEDRAFLQVFAVVHGPGASSQFSFEWKRDFDSPDLTDGTVNSAIEIIPLYYSAIGIYGGSTASALNGVTPNVVGLTAEYESDTAAIEIVTNQVTLKGDNRRYLILGNVYGEGFASGGRTQRRLGLDVDGSQRLGASGYLFARNASNDNNGAIVSDLIETTTADVVVELTCWQGDGAAAFQGGSDGAGAVPALAYNALVVVELNNGAEVFRGYDSGSVSGVGGTEIALTGPVDLPCVETLSFNDSASFTKASNAAVNVEQAGDYFFCGSEFNARGNVTAAVRFTYHAHITKNGVEDSATRHGNYNRGDQSTSGTFGGGSTPAGFMACAANDEIGISAQEIAGTEGGGGNVETIDIGFWGVNLDTLEGGDTHYTLQVDAGSYASSGADAGLTAARVIPAAAGAIAVTGLAAALSVAYTLPAEAGAYALTGLDVGLVTDRVLTANPGSVALAGQDVGLSVAYALPVETGVYGTTGIDARLVTDQLLTADPGSVTLTGHDVVLSLAVTYTMTAETGAYVASGSGAGLTVDRVLAADPGSVALTGHDVVLSVINVYSMLAESGAYGMTGNDVGLAVGRSLIADLGSVALAGQDVGFALAYALHAEAVAYSLSGIDVNLFLSGIPASAERTIQIPATDRMITIPAEDRLLTISAVDRTIRI
ncbi:MAG: hypothetical protein KUF79_17335 [Candidatus Thiodiazotropha sp. (ex Ctena orbiculata)]|nr:hypothetical protein [Candidatus Thiodiazotropha taylori]